MGTQPKKYKIDEQFLEASMVMELPQFYKKVDKSELDNSILFDELKEEDIFLNKNNLLDGFNILNQNSTIDFNEVTAEIKSVDYSESKKTAEVGYFKKRTIDILLVNIFK